MHSKREPTLRRVVGRRNSGVNGDGEPGEFAEMAPRVDFSMESKMLGIPMENEGIQVLMEMANQAKSQKWHLELTSVWRAKCKEFHRKMKEFKC